MAKWDETRRKVVSRPLILVTNDDGIDAAGIDALSRAVELLGEVWVVAPKDEQSAVSSAISLRHPLRVWRRGERRVAVSGTPTDCVYIALNHLLKRRPTICVSGINHGANLSEDVIYSGTVAGAIEATICDIPSIAFSFAGRGGYDFEATQGHVQEIVKVFLGRGIPRGVLINVNFPPDLTKETPSVLTKLGRRNYGRGVVAKTDPRGQEYYWLGGAELGFDDMPGSDCNAVVNSKISVTPVHLDLTHYNYMRELKGWPLFGG